MQKNDLTELPSFLTSKEPWKIYLSDNYLVLDFETTNLNFGFAGEPKNRLLLSTFCRADGKVKYDEADEFRQRVLAREIESVDFIVCQNAKFELQWLQRMGVRTERLVVFDTMLAEYVWLGNRRGPKDLDSLCKKYGLPTKNKLVSQLMQGGVCPSLIPRRALIEYGVEDTRNTHGIFLKQRELLLNLNLLPVLFTRCLTTPVLAEIEMNGMHANKTEVEREYQETLKRFTEAQDRVTEVTGGINLNSPKQVSEFLYDTRGFPELVGRDGEPLRTEKGGRRTDEDAIAALEATTPEQREVKEAFLLAKPLYKRLDALTKLRGCCDEDLGLLFANINQAVAQTHRTTSSGKKWKLQFQNFDRDLKSVFSARHTGWLVGETDGTALEFRGAGHLGRDPRIRADVLEGADPHLFSAQTIFKKVASAVTSALRTEAKKFTFKPLFGGQSGTPDEKRYYKAFKEKYHVLADCQRDWAYKVLETGTLITEWGLRFYWPGTTISKSGYISNTTSIYNYPIQSFSTAEIIPISLVYFWHRVKRAGLRLFLVNTVHDSIVAELPPDEEDDFRRISNQAFTEDVYGYLKRNYNIDIYLPLGCETKVGEAWGKGKGVKFENKLNFLA